MTNKEALLEACKEFVRFSELPKMVSRDDHIRYQTKAIAAARAAIAFTESTKE